MFGSHLTISDRCGNGSARANENGRLYILTVMVKNDEEADRNEKAYKKFELALRLGYGNDVVITRIKPKSEKEVAEAFDKLQASVDEKTEVLIIMNGHGGVEHDL